MSYAYLFKYIIIGDTGKIWKDNFETTKVMENFANKKKKKMFEVLKKIAE